jgi:hypothetical protein
MDVRDHNPVPEGILSGTAQALLLELAAGLEETKEICEKYSVTAAELTIWLGHPAFRDMLREAKRKFASLGNTADRVKTKAQLLVEINLPVMHDLVNDSRAMPAARVSAFTAIRSLTGLEKPEPQPVGAVFKLEIKVEPNASPILIEGEVDNTRTLAVIHDDGEIEGQPPYQPDYEDDEYAGNQPLD